MISTEQLLDIALIIGLSFLTIFFIVACFYVIFILRDISKITSRARELSERGSHIAEQPLKVVEFFTSKLDPWLEKMKEKNK